MNQLSRDMSAAAEWMAADAWRVFMAQQTHRPDEDGLCVAHSRLERYPCMTAMLASFAELICRERMIADRMPEPRGTSE